MMTTVMPERQTTPRWMGHALGVALGLGFVLLLWGQTLLREWARVQVAQFAQPHAIYLDWAATAALGAIAVVIVLAAPRLPALPTAAAALLVYGVLSDPFFGWGALPNLGPWQPRMTSVVGAPGAAWDATVVTLMLGVMTVAAVRGWVLARRPPVGDTTAE